jgi:hypothetical protein
MVRAEVNDPGDRVALHEDKHPPEHKRAAHQKLIAAEQVFQTIYAGRGLR